MLLLPPFLPQVHGNMLWTSKLFWLNQQNIISEYIYGACCCSRL